MSPALLEFIITSAIKYGPEAAQDIIAVFKKVFPGDPTLNDLEVLFGKLRTYASFGIPDKAPTTPAS